MFKKIKEWDMIVGGLVLIGIGVLAVWLFSKTSWTVLPNVMWIEYLLK